MAPRTDMDDLRAAWRALVGGCEREGWKTIPVASSAPCSLLAGRHLPGDEEALLVGFRDIRTISDFYLPQGNGFEVVRLATDPTGGDRLWVGLARRPGGSLELFAMMADDLLHLLEDGEGRMRAACSSDSCCASVLGKNSWTSIDKACCPPRQNSVCLANWSSSTA